MLFPCQSAVKKCVSMGKTGAWTGQQAANVRVCGSTKDCVIAISCYTSKWKGHRGGLFVKGISAFKLSLLSACNAWPAK